VNDHEEECSRGLEVYQVTTFDASGIVAAIVQLVKNEVVDLAFRKLRPW
jgi:hypothetical protein